LVSPAIHDFLQPSRYVSIHIINFWYLIEKKKTFIFSYFRQVARCLSNKSIPPPDLDYLILTTMNPQIERSVILSALSF